jgi:L-2-hydroxyglutarate oxidase LhgO
MLCFPRRGSEFWRVADGSFCDLATAKIFPKEKKLTPRRGHAGLDDVAGGLGRSSSNFRHSSVTPADDD